MQKITPTKNISDTLEAVVGMKAYIYVLRDGDGNPYLRCEIEYPDGAHGVKDNPTGALLASAKNYINAAGKDETIKGQAGWT